MPCRTIVGNNPYVNLQGLSTEEPDANRSVVVADSCAAVRNDRFLEALVSRISIEPGEGGKLGEGTGARVRLPFA